MLVFLVIPLAGILLGVTAIILYLLIRKRIRRLVDNSNQPDIPIRGEGFVKAGFFAGIIAVLTGVFIVVGFTYFVKSLKPVPNYPVGDARLYFYGEPNTTERAIKTILLPDSMLMTLGWRERYNPNSQSTEYDAIFLKTDFNGVQRFQKVIPSVFGYRMMLSRNDEILVCMVDGSSKESSTQSKRFRISRYSLHADSVDSRTYEFDLPVTVTDFIALPDDCNALLISTGEDSTSQKGHFLMKIDAYGDSLWMKPIPFEQNTVYSAMTAASSVDLIATGYRENQQFNRYNLRLSKFNANGEVVWQLSESDTIEIGGTDVIETADGSLLVLGSRWVERNRLTGYLLKFSVDGRLLWEKEIGGDYYSFLVGLVPWNEGWLALGWTVQNESLLKFSTQRIRQWYTYQIILLSVEGETRSSFNGGKDFLLPWDITTIDRGHCIITGFGGTNIDYNESSNSNVDIGILHYRSE